MANYNMTDMIEDIDTDWDPFEDELERTVSSTHDQVDEGGLVTPGAGMRGTWGIS